MLLCLDSEWHGCASPDVERGARLLARDLFSDLPYIDFGISDAASQSVRDGVLALDQVVARLHEVTRGLKDSGADRVFTVGGTCGCEAAPVAYLAERHARLGAVWLDAHGDLNTPGSSPSGHFHGMVLRTLLGEGPEGFTGTLAPLDPRLVVIVGARQLDPGERDYLSSAPVGLVEGWPDDTASRVSAHLREAHVERLYVHLDVDVFDPIAFGDALFPVPGGPSLEDTAVAVRTLLEEFELAGVGVVESCDRYPQARDALVAFLASSGLWGAD